MCYARNDTLLSLITLIYNPNLAWKICLVVKDFFDMYKAGKLAFRTLQLWQDFDEKYAVTKHCNGFITYVDAEAR